MEVSMYKELKAKRNINDRVNQWEANLIDIVTSMFEYKGFPDTVNTEFIELYLNTFGECAIWETNDGFAVTFCSRAGSPNVNGLGKDLICTTFNGQSKTFNDFENSKEVVYIRNDKYANPDFNIEPIAEFLANADKSLKHLIINARYTPIPIAHNDIERKAIEGALNANNNDECKPQVIISDNVLSDIISESVGRETKVLNITDVSASDKIQYIHKSKDDTLRQFYNLYGMETCGSSKMAQQSVAEINSGCNSHLVIPEVRLSERKKGIDKCKEYFGWDCSVDYSICWKREEKEQEMEQEMEQVEQVEREESENEESVQSGESTGE